MAVRLVAYWGKPSDSPRAVETAELLETRRAGYLVHSMVDWKAALMVATLVLPLA